MAPTGPELAGARVRLLPVAPAHHDALLALHRTPEVARWWYEPDAAFPAGDPDTVDYTIVADGTVAGYIQWSAEEDPHFRHAGYDLFLGPAFTGRGLGTEAGRILCAHLVDDRGFQRIVIDPEVDNGPAIASYRKVGFKPVGVMRRYSVDDRGAYHDGLLMDLLAEELVRQ
jgi:aminoglycoside 6'-N-acetyltransferase